MVAWRAGVAVALLSREVRARRTGWADRPAVCRAATPAPGGAAGETQPARLSAALAAIRQQAGDEESQRSTGLKVTEPIFLKQSRYLRASCCSLRGLP